MIAVGTGAVTIAASRRVDPASQATTSQATTSQATTSQAAAAAGSKPIVLVAGTPTPAAAPFTLAWLPAGWKLLTWQAGEVSYASPDRPSGDQYVGPVGNLDVSYRNSEPPVRVSGGPVTMVDTSPGQGQVLMIRAGAAHTIVIQIRRACH